jgi:two-component system, cell cycle sensor histidine kinase and response regulator CckA
MADGLCLLTCEYTATEIAAVFKNLAQQDIDLATYPGRCDRPAGCAGRDASNVCVLGCLGGYGPKANGGDDGRPSVMTPQCTIEMLLGEAAFDAGIRKGVHYLTPAMLARWNPAPKNSESAAAANSACIPESPIRYVLLDTGLSPVDNDRLRAISEHSNCPAETHEVSLDVLQQNVENLIRAWREEVARRAARGGRRKQRREHLADYALVQDLTGSLAASLDEESVVEGLLSLFLTLCAPSSVHFLSTAGTTAGTVTSRFDGPGDETTWVQEAMGSLKEAYRMTDDGRGFLFQVMHGGSRQGVVAVCAIAISEHLRHYLNVAILAAPVVGLALSNSRTFRGLQETKRRYLETINRSWDAIIGLDNDGCVHLVNPSAQRLFGHATHELGQLTVNDLFTNRDHQKLRQALGHTHGGDDARGQLLELRARRKDASEFIAECSVSAAAFEGPATSTLVIRDISRRRKAENHLRSSHDELEKSVEVGTAELLKSERKYRSLIEKAGDAIFHLNGSSGRLIDVNSEACRALNYSRSDLIACTLVDIDPEWTAEHLDTFSKGLKSNETRTIQSRHRRSDGTTFPVEIRVGRATGGGQNTLLAVARDITERQRAEEELRAAEEKYEDLYERAPDMFVSVNPTNAQIEKCNQTVADKLGYAKSELIGKPIFFVYHEDCMEDVDRAFQSFLDTGSVENAALQLKTKTGEKIEVILKATSVRDSDGNILQSRSSWRDVTDLKREENLRRTLEARLQHTQKLETVGVLAGGVAHDFNNILAAILGFTELLKMRPDLSQTVREDLSEIERASKRAADLTAQLLAFGRKQVLQPRILNPNKIIGRVIKLAIRLIGENISLSTDLDLDAGCVNADPGQIEQVLMNLIVNARDAMPVGGVLTVITDSVDLDAAATDRHPSIEPGRFVRISVRDTGTGIDEATMARVFEPFFTTKEQGRGTGLGLSTVYGIVRQSGGFVDVYSDHEIGTSFEVYLPMVEGEMKPVREPEDPSSFRGTESILVLEDDKRILRLTKRILERAGYEVRVVSNGAEALDQAQRGNPIELLLSDVVLGESNGPEVAKQLLDKHPTLRVIFMSGYAPDALQPQHAVGHATNVLQKPLTQVRLLSEIRKALDE